MSTETDGRTDGGTSDKKEKIKVNISPQENIFLVTSRFNNETISENRAFKSAFSDIKCIYGAPIQLSPKIQPTSIIYVIEMNNDTNEIEGIGVIKNKPNVKLEYTPYENRHYNRFVYIGNYYISKEVLVTYNENVIKLLEILLFKGKTHMKRSSGLTLFPEKLNKDSRCPPNTNIKMEIRNIFLRHFANKNT